MITACGSVRTGP